MNKKIHLTRESVRQVSAEELPHVRGGVSIELPQRKTKKKTTA